MKGSYFTRIKKWNVAVWLVLSWMPHAMGAQFVEVTAEIEGTFWPVRGAESRNSYSVRCIIGTNSWMIEGDFARNSTTTYWFTGTNLIKHILITKEFSESSVRNRAGPVLMAPAIGKRFTTVRNLSNGGPTDGGGYANVVWLAYCSSAYLKKDEQPIPLPIGVNPRAQYAQDYSQTNSVFEDELGLPTSVELHTPDNHLLCRYDVQQSTNVAGWRLPQRFKVSQYRPGPNGEWEPHGEAVGRLTSARSADEPSIPANVLNQTKQ